MGEGVAPLPKGSLGYIEAVYPHPPWPVHPVTGKPKHAMGFRLVVKFDGQPDDIMKPITGLRGWPMAEDEIEPA